MSVELFFVIVCAVTSVIGLIAYCSASPGCPVPAVQVDNECCNNKADAHS